MPGVPRGLAEHRLRVDSKAKPVKEHLRRSAVQKRKAIGKEVARLLAAEFIREILPLRVARQCRHGPQKGQFTLHVHRF